MATKRTISELHFKIILEFLLLRTCICLVSIRHVVEYLVKWHYFLTVVFLVHVQRHLPIKQREQIDWSRVDWRSGVRTNNWSQIRRENRLVIRNMLISICRILLCQSVPVPQNVTMLAKGTRLSMGPQLIAQFPAS